MNFRARSCELKVRMETRKDARRVAKKRGKTWYRCQFCDGYHLTSSTELELPTQVQAALLVEKFRDLGGVVAEPSRDNPSWVAFWSMGELFRGDTAAMLAYMLEQWMRHKHHSGTLKVFG